MVQEIDLSILDENQEHALTEAEGRQASEEQKLEEERAELRRLVVGWGKGTVPMAVKERIEELDRDINAADGLASRVETGRNKLEALKIQKRSAEAHKLSIRQLKGKIATGTDDEQYRTRAQLAQEIRRVIKRIEFGGIPVSGNICWEETDYGNQLRARYIPDSNDDDYGDRYFPFAGDRPWSIMYLQASQNPDLAPAYALRPIKEGRGAGWQYFRYGIKPILS
jgi:hypothetical protein